MDYSRQVKELRERTGAGMIDCRKAIEITKGNIDEAYDLIWTMGNLAMVRFKGKSMQEAYDMLFNKKEENQMKSFEQFLKDFENNKIESGMYTSKNEKGEDLTIMIEKGVGITVYTNQLNGWRRVNEYDKDGFMESEGFEGKWKEI